MKRDYASSLSTLQARTIIAVVASIVLPSILSVASVMSLSVTVANDIINRFPVLFSAVDFSAVVAFVQSAIVRRSYSEGKINLFEYVSLYAREKQENKLFRNDKGWFGDLFEVLIRIAIIDNFNLVRASALTVAEYNRIDINSSKYGKIEVGHNGKTWSNGTMFDYMDGDYKTVVYGMFSDIDEELIFKYCVNGQLEKAITEVKKRTGIWTDKHEFYSFMNSLGKNGRTIKAFSIRSGKIVNQFTDGMYYRFMEEIENGNVTTL